MQEAETLTPGLVLIHGNRAEQLCELIVAWLHQHPLAPLETECVLVHSNGVAQWLRLALAQHGGGRGIAAGLDFLLPSRFIWRAYRAVLGQHAVPDESPLDKSALIWRLMRLLPQWAPQPGFQVLAHFLRDDDTCEKRYQLAGRLADLFDQYQVYRADWLSAWAAGHETLSDVRGQALPMPSDQQWQARLWRGLLDDLGVADQPVGRAAIHAAFLAKLGEPAVRPPGLPRRVVVFGVSALPRQSFEALAALAPWVQILVCVHNPCAHYWADIEGERDRLQARYRRQSRRAPGDAPVQVAQAQGNPLLASWGRQGRDFVAMLDDFDDPAARADWNQAFAALHRRIDLFEQWPGRTLLQQLQDDIRDLRGVAESRALWPAVDVAKDHSLRFQIAHSAQREVEILHDQLLAAFAADDSLRPRDVIVMMPDIGGYAPHIQAVFGLHEARDPRHIPYTLADQGQRHADPLVIVLEQLLRLEHARMGIQEILEWLDIPAVRARFAIEPADLPHLRRWLEQANVRWGLHAEQRAGFGLAQPAAAAHAHTWHFGLQRLLLGCATGAQAPAWQGIEACPGPGGLQAASLGGLTRLLDTVDRYWRVLRQARAPQQWASCLRDLLDDFFLPLDAQDEHTLMRFREIVQDWAGQCALARLEEPLPVSIVAEHCLAQLDEAALTQRFFAGAVTFATLMPMRAIPFRRVYLLGLHDGAFPRLRVPADFDLMVRHPRYGDRSRRDDDRYLFLEALLSARDHLSISWIGHDIHDNHVQPPSVLVAQLMEHLDRGWCSTDGGTLSAALSCRHPLQPFSPRYFKPSVDQFGERTHDVLFTYASEWRVAHRQPASRGAPSDTSSAPVPRGTEGVLAVLSEAPDTASLPEMPLSLETLTHFLRDPIAFFFRERLGVRFDDMPADLEEDEPYVVDGLQAWQLRDELLRAIGALQSPADHSTFDDVLDERLEQMRRRGSLMTGVFGQSQAATLKQALADALDAYIEVCGQWPEAVAEPMRLNGVAPVGTAMPQAPGRVLSRLDTAMQGLPGAGLPQLDASLAGWRQDADGQWCRVCLTASHLVDAQNRYRFRPLIGGWVAHVAAHIHGRHLTTWIISPKGRVRFEPLAQEPAALWEAWWGAWVQGLQAALPIDAETAAAWLRGGAQSERQSQACLAAGNTYGNLVARSVYLRRSFRNFDELSADGRFFDWARTLYGDLNAALNVSHNGRGRPS